MVKIIYSSTSTESSLHELKAHTVILTVTDEYGCTNPRQNFANEGFNALPITYSGPRCVRTWSKKPQNSSPNEFFIHGAFQMVPILNQFITQPWRIFSRESECSHRNHLYLRTSPDKSCSKDTSFIRSLWRVQTLKFHRSDVLGADLHLWSMVHELYRIGLYQWEFLPDPLESTDPSPCLSTGPSDNYSLYGPRIDEIRLELVTAGGCLIDTDVDTFGSCEPPSSLKYKNICAGDTLRFLTCHTHRHLSPVAMGHQGDGDTLKSTSTWISGMCTILVIHIFPTSDREE